MTVLTTLERLIEFPVGCQERHVQLESQGQVQAVVESLSRQVCQVEGGEDQWVVGVPPYRRQPERLPDILSVPVGEFAAMALF